tara:strand:+ start:151 stop:297 length:147 start_codon:yes stop_codon:yes gene_type:complete
MVRIGPDQRVVDVSAQDPVHGVFESNAEDRFEGVSSSISKDRPIDQRY